MRTLFKMMALIAAALATVLQAVFEGGKWILKSVRAQFAPPVGAGAGIEQALEDGSDVGSQIATAAQKPAPAAANDDVGFGAEIPVPAYDASQDWGAVAKAYVRARVYDQTEPSLADLDEHTELWLRGLSTDECMRLHSLPAARISAHIFGAHRLRGLAPCHEYDRSLPPVHLADTEQPDARHREILDDLENDPEAAPGYVAPRAA